MDSDGNSPIVINLDSYCRTPLTSQENKTYERARKINLKEKQWSRKPMKTVSKYSCAFEELLEDGKASEFLVCKIWVIHYQWHFGGYDIDKLKSDYKNQITCAALKGNPFRFFESEEFHQIVTAYGKLCVAHEKVGTLCESGSVTPSRIGIAQAVRDRATGREEQQEYKGLLERIKFPVLSATILAKTRGTISLLRPFIINFGEWSGSEKTRKTVTEFIHNLLIKKGAAACETVTQIGRTTDEGQNMLSGGEGVLVAQHGDDSLKADLAALSVFKEDFEAYTGIFEAFSLAVAKLEVAKSPTINLVLPVLAKLELHIQRCSDDQGEEHSLQRALARSALSCLARKIERSVNRKIVCAAAYLDPNILRKMESISKKVPRWSLNEGSVRHLVTQLELWDRRCTGGGSATEIILENDVFAEFASSPPVSSLENEMRLYETMPCTKIVDLLEFWREQKFMPNLKRLAQKILCIPASSAHAERAFSHLRRLKTDFTRCNMAEETISAIICCGSLNHLKVFDDTDHMLL
ncbi:hypothetical protein niasHT_020532 [Heterodera trifolii]|uniref:HAT C-terminal dimerisation domain-containing protein n=1 Tax=Heterodera trifolii TaxID=157864 RepID=A0ABD2J9H5_9BILA